MRTIYIDSESKCHVENNGTLLEVQTEFFANKCDTFVEGYCSKDKGNGCREFFPWKPYSELAAAQAQYEQDLADRADLEAAYNYLLDGGTA